MCTNVAISTSIDASAKGPEGWIRIDTAHVSFDHPQHAPFDHTLNIDLVNQRSGAPTRVAIELSPESARSLVDAITTALSLGEVEAGLAR